MAMTAQGCGCRRWWSYRGRGAESRATSRHQKTIADTLTARAQRLMHGSSVRHTKK